jgi:4-hydroxythreonine-4-phosphate dehydrogenase
MSTPPRIIITPGEPTGIGPDITLHIAQQAWPAELICIADPDLLLARAAQLQLPLTLHATDFSKPSKTHQPGSLNIIPVKLTSAVTPGKPDKTNARYVLTCLEKATTYCLDKQAQALVTGPVNKSIINDAGIAFTGHTEFLAARCQITHPIMLFVTKQTRVALATTHVPLARVSEKITQEYLLTHLRILHNELKKLFHIKNPKILVCGLNPHAGENGHLGHEEIDVIQPALKQLQNENINVIGPLPADTLFTEKYLKTADAVLAMYHDQALPVVKYMSFGHAVNVTLGLPIIRTSVDHGTALDIAGTGQADSGSLAAALQLAIDLSPSQ